jgi:hypothetical protein
VDARNKSGHDEIERMAEMSEKFRAMGSEVYVEEE